MNRYTEFIIILYVIMNRLFSIFSVSLRQLTLMKGLKLLRNTAVVCIVKYNYKMMLKIQFQNEQKML